MKIYHSRHCAVSPKYRSSSTCISPQWEIFILIQLLLRNISVIGTITCPLRPLYGCKLKGPKPSDGLTLAHGCFKGCKIRGWPTCNYGHVMVPFCTFGHIMVPASQRLRISLIENKPSSTALWPNYGSSRGQVLVPITISWGRL